jgi:hypothetical protein
MTGTTFTTMQTTSGRCPECGAPRVEGMTCWEQLGLLFTWEYKDPALQAEHFLTVAAYNLQHPAQFTDDALAGLRALFIEHLDNALAITEIRHRVGQAAAGSNRVLRSDAERKPRLRVWSMTIADVCLPDSPEGAATRVRAWAASIRKAL